MTRFSIIMPVYNCELYVEKTMKSVLDQTYTNYELLIIDDGSTDKTKDIVLKYVNNYKHIKFFQSNHNGVSAARNIGINNARSEFVLFVDGDDLWNERLLEICSTYLNHTDDSCLLFGIRSDYYRNGFLQKSISSAEAELTSSRFFKLDYEVFKNINLCSPCNKVYRLSVLNKFNIRFSEECVYLEDLKFNLEYYKYYDKIFVLNQDLYYYRLNCDINQIFKRNFKFPFKNADGIYSASVNLSQKIGNGNIRSPLKELCLDAYLKEMYCYLKKQDRVEYIKILNSNVNFLYLLQIADGKMMKLLKVAVILKLYTLEYFLIDRRYG